MTSGQPEPSPLDRDRYRDLSQAPLQVLLFLFPLVVFYELLIGSWGASNPLNLPADIYARRLIFEAFDALGVSGRHLPMFIIIVVLLAWHLAKRDRWRIEPRVYGWMWVESLAWALPLYVFSIVYHRHVAGLLAGAEALDVHHLGQTLQAAALQATDVQPLQHSWRAELVFAIGAGLYEELTFRLFGITFLHMALSDWLGMKKGLADGLAVALTSGAFAFYHFSDAYPFNWPAFIFYLAAGLYLGLLFRMRGFGIVVAAHALYDVLVLVFGMIQNAQ